MNIADASKRHAALAVTALLVLALTPAGMPLAADDRAFGAKPWLLAPAPEKPTPLEKHRASVYRSALQRELRRLELKGPLSDIRSLDRRNSFRRELSRIERAQAPATALGRDPVRTLERLPVHLARTDHGRLVEALGRGEPLNRFQGVRPES